MTKFSSDAALVRHYFKELLSDGREYTIHEVLAYVLSQNGEMGVNAKPITYDKVQNALFQFLRSDTCGYMMARRGVYVKNKAVSVSDEPAVQPVIPNPFCDNALRILSAAKIGVRSCFASCFVVMEISGEVNFSLRDTESAVMDLLEEAMKKMDEIKT